MELPLPTALALGRRTRQLEAVYAVVREARDHPTAEQVHARVRRTLPQVSLGTVYRNLQKLATVGRIRVVELGPGRTRFDGMVEAHEHFVCERCGEITDLASDGEPRPRPPALHRHGFTVTRHALTFYGLCPGCRTAAGADAPR